MLQSVPAYRTLPPRFHRMTPCVFLMKTLVAIFLTLLSLTNYTLACNTFNPLVTFATLLTSLWVIITKSTSRPCPLCAYATVNTNAFPSLTNVSMDAFANALSCPLAEMTPSTGLYENRLSILCLFLCIITTHSTCYKCLLSITLKQMFNLFLVSIYWPTLPCAMSTFVVLTQAFWGLQSSNFSREPQFIYLTHVHIKYRARNQNFQPHRSCARPIKCLRTDARAVTRSLYPSSPLRVLYFGLRIQQHQRNACLSTTAARLHAHFGHLKLDYLRFYLSRNYYPLRFWYLYISIQV